MATEIIQQPTDEQIRTRAYYLWEADGCPQGRDWEYWHAAKEQLETQGTPEKAPAMAASAKRSSNSANGKSSSTPSKRRTTSRAAAYA